MTFFAPMQSAGIRRQIIEFHGNFTSCIATISFAKEPGGPTAITRSIIDKRMVEIQSITASNANCSVQNGNVFGGGA